MTFGGPDRFLEIEDLQDEGVEANMEQDNNPQVEEVQSATVFEESNSEEAGTMDKEFKLEGRDKSYYELEKKLSEQGAELGQYRKYYEEVSPVIDLIQNDEQVLNTVLGKIYDEKAPTEEQGVSDEQPSNEYATQDVLNYVDNRIQGWEDKQKFERQVDDFIALHPDFNEKLPKIMEVIDKYNIDKDIELAYKLASYDDLESKVKSTKAVTAIRKDQAALVGDRVPPKSGDIPISDPVWDVFGKPRNANNLFG